MKEENYKIYSNEETCPVRQIVDRIGDKWSILILIVLNEGNILRFSEIHKRIVTISQKMLTVTLKSLVADGLVDRKVYPEIPPKVEYQLTARGESLMPHLLELIKWAKTNMDDIKLSREFSSNQN